jgi:hypothetical protein
VTMGVNDIHGSKVSNFIVLSNSLGSSGLAKPTKI